MPASGSASKLEKDIIAVGVGPELRMPWVASPAISPHIRCPPDAPGRMQQSGLYYRMMPRGRPSLEFEGGSRARHQVIRNRSPSIATNSWLEAAPTGLAIAYFLRAADRTL